jgi:serine/threonine protein kinase
VLTNRRAVGCVLYELCSLKRAFEGQSLPALIMKILRGKFPPLSPNYSAPLHALVGACLSRRPSQRPSIAAILDMPFMRPHLQAYFLRVGQIMGIQPEELRLPSARKLRPAVSPRTHCDNAR